jgi:hypothetical protein
MHAWLLDLATGQHVVLCTEVQRRTSIEHAMLMQCMHAKLLLLASKRSVVLCVVATWAQRCRIVMPFCALQECLHMAPGKEVAFLRKRTGFVRLALQQGVPLVPAFAFGQTSMYRWIQPGPPLVPAGWVNALSRSIGERHAAWRHGGMAACSTQLAWGVLTVFLRPLPQAPCRCWCLATGARGAR